MTRKLIIDRFEGKFAVCEEFQPEQKGAKEKKPAKNAKEIRFFGIERTELPEGAVEGSVLSIDDDGVLAIDEAATAARRAKIRAAQARLAGKN